VTYLISDKKAPKITAENRTVNVGDKNAVKGVTARQKDGTNVTKKMKVTIVDPSGETAAKNISYKEAKKFVFDKAGDYKVTYNAANTKYPNKKKSKTITITAIDNTQPQPQPEPQPEQQQEQQQEQGGQQ
jgi:hypothetical protein